MQEETLKYYNNEIDLENYDNVISLSYYNNEITLQMNTFIAIEQEFTPQALAIFNAMPVEPSNERKQQIDDLFVKPIIAAGLWEKGDAFHMFANHTSRKA